MGWKAVESQQRGQIQRKRDERLRWKYGVKRDIENE